MSRSKDEAVTAEEAEVQRLWNERLHAKKEGRPEEYARAVEDHLAAGARLAELRKRKGLT